MIEFDHSSKIASAEWLTSVLTRNGYLASGEVIAVDQKPSRIRMARSSEFFELKLKYSSARTAAPSNCLMKVGRPELFDPSRKEVAFYELVRGNEHSTGLLTTFGTAINDIARSAVILMEDKRDAFYVTEWPLPPNINDCEQAVRSLAAIHATWWNSPSLENEGFDRLSRFVHLPDDSPRRLLAAFFDAVGDGISKPRRAIVERLLERYPQTLKQRIDETPHSQTLVHDDAHFWNVLLPKNEWQVPIWIDWQTWGVSFGAHDLAYLIGLHWFPERRRRFEKNILRTYLAELHRRGIDYRYDDLTYDYRLQVAGQLFTPMYFWALKVPASTWWPHLDRAFSAFDDLDCHELFRV